MSFSPLRRAQPAEAKAVTQLLQAAGKALQAQGFQNWSQPYPMNFIREQIRRGEVWVMEEEGEPIATLTLDFVLPDEYQAEWFTEPSAPAAYLHRLAVHPSRHGAGLGRSALHEAERITLEHGLHWLRFDAYTRNAGIQTFYQKHGYARLRDFQMTFPSIGTDTFTLYEKKLSHPALP